MTIAATPFDPVAFQLAVSSWLTLDYVPDVETIDGVGSRRCGVYYLYVEGQPAGAVSMTEITGCHGEIGYEIDTEYRGHGLATEAVNAVSAAAAARHGFTVLTAQVRAGNAASRRVLEKNGYAPCSAKLCWPIAGQHPISMITYRRFLAPTASGSTP